MEHRMDEESCSCGWSQSHREAVLVVVGVWPPKPLGSPSSIIGFWTCRYRTSCLPSCILGLLWSDFFLFLILPLWNGIIYSVPLMSSCNFNIKLDFYRSLQLRVCLDAHKRFWLVPLKGKEIVDGEIVVSCQVDNYELAVVFIWIFKYVLRRYLCVGLTWGAS